MRRLREVVDPHLGCAIAAKSGEETGGERGHQRGGAAESGFVRRGDGDIERVETRDRGGWLRVVIVVGVDCDCCAVWEGAQL